MTECRHGQKVRYRDRIAALSALSRTQSKTTARRNECRAYRCSKCGGWYLTSETYRKRKG